MSSTTYAGLSQRTNTYADTVMLRHQQPNEILSKFGLVKPIPKNTANNVTFRRPIPLAPATTPLVEGTPPAGKQMRYENVTVTLARYGDYVEITDDVSDMAEDPVIEDASILCGEQRAETIEKICWGVLRGGTSVVFNNGSARNAVNTALSANKLDSCIRTLLASRPQMISKMISAGINIGTKPVEAAFIAFGHTDLERDIRALSGFSTVTEYGSFKVVSDFEVGARQRVRFILSPHFEYFASAGGAHGGVVKTDDGTSGNVYPLIIIGQDAFGHTGIRGVDPKATFIKKPGTVDSGDPLGQKGHVGWKRLYAAVRLNESWIIRLETGAAAL